MHFKILIIFSTKDADEKHEVECMKGDKANIDERFGFGTNYAK